MVSSIIAGLLVGFVAYFGFDADGQIAFLMGLVVFYGELTLANAEVINKNVKKLHDKVVDSK